MRSRTRITRRRFYQYAAGEIDLHDGRRLYINRGLGYLRRVRFNVRPEITAFKLTRDRERGRESFS